MIFAKKLVELGDHFEKADETINADVFLWPNSLEYEHLANQVEALGRKEVLHFLI